jgi:hypothetical protein
MKNQFFDLLKTVERAGMNDLIEYIETHTDFFKAPASTQHHGAFDGGLVSHSLAVYDNLVKTIETFKIEANRETVIIVALLHDLCKANFYKKSFRNKKNEHGVWEQIDCYEIADQFPAGHGEKSVILLQHFIKLKAEEIMAIRWHMLGFDDACKSYGGGQALSNATKKYPLIVALHMADLASTYFDGR